MTSNGKEEKNGKKERKMCEKNNFENGRGPFEIDSGIRDSSRGIKGGEKAISKLFRLLKEKRIAWEMREIMEMINCLPVSS